MTAASTRPADHMFPTLSPAQAARMATYGHPRAVSRGETLMEPGEVNPSCFLVTRGSVEIVRVTPEGESLVHTHLEGQFTGEANMLSGRRAFVRIRAVADGEV